MKICLVLHKYAIPLEDPCCYPLGFMYASAVLKRIGHEVKVLNYNLWDYDFEKEIKGQDIVGFTGFEEFFPCIVRDASICRHKGIHTIIGGALATFKPEVMRFHVDGVVMGEVEPVFGGDGVMEQLYGVFKCDKPPDLTDLPFPDYQGFGINEYHKRHTARYMGILTARGCPFHCTFCAQTCKFQMRPLQDVFKEIDLYSDLYEVGSIVFNDNTLNLNKVRFLELCKGMKERHLRWGAAIRVEPWDDDMAKAAKESGCQYFVVGVESFNQDRLDMMNKQVKVEQIEKCLDSLIRHRIGYSGNILVGFENDTHEDVTKEILSIPKRFKVYPVMVQPFVGTKNGHTRKLSTEEYGFFSDLFRDYAESCGKYLYPALPEGGIE